MTGKTNYPTPSPTLAVITTSVNAFEIAVHDALDGGKIAIVTRNAARAELLALLRQLAAYVTGNCKTELAILIGSGFNAVKTPSPAGVLPAPQDLRLDYTGISGELLLRFRRVYNAANYTVQTRQIRTVRGTDYDLSTDLAREDHRSHAGQGLLGARLCQRFARSERLGRPSHSDGGVGASRTGR